jgi:hypothetical protein
VITVAGVWFPLREALTPANAGKKEQVLALLPGLPPDVRLALYQLTPLHPFEVCADLREPGLADTTRTD